MILNTSLTSKSGRIALVPPQESDDAAVAALRSHPETRRYLRFFPDHVSIEESRERRVTRAADPTVLAFNIHALTAGSSPQFVGTTVLSHIHDGFKSCEAGIIIRPEYSRGGLATDALYTLLAHAFEERKLHRAVFLTAVDNEGMCSTFIGYRMRGWLDWVGATLEGIDRESWTDGNCGFTDVCRYSILEQEWAESVKGRLEGRINRRPQS